MYGVPEFLGKPVYSGFLHAWNHVGTNVGRRASATAAPTRRAAAYGPPIETVRKYVAAYADRAVASSWPPARERRWDDRALRPPANLASKGWRKGAAVTEAALRLAIEVASGGLGYAAWTIGITDDPGRSRAEHGNPVGWRSWQADSEPTTRLIEQTFRDQGMKGSPAGGSAPTYVYIF